MKKIILLCIAATSSMAVNAQWFGSENVKGNGNVITVERSTENYDAVGVAGFFDVELIAGTEGKITITAEENLIPHIETEVKNGELQIKTEKGYNLSTSRRNSILIIVPFESLDAVSLAGSGDVITKNTIKTNAFKANLAGSGDLTLDVESTSVESHLAGSGDVVLRGSTGDFECALSGSGDISAKQLKAKNVDVSISGSGDVDVHCNGELKVRVSGSGDVEYYGNPTKEDSKVSGSGDVSRG
ncbi:head GIN domain-containing protein [Galbibacter orientalis]|uniref:head GIN domain-containing protein n=1 Tax=Galbibacter orientalis TaxID=453852 RepID=UPI003002D7A9